MLSFVRVFAFYICIAAGLTWALFALGLADSLELPGFEGSRTVAAAPQPVPVSNPVPAVTSEPAPKASPPREVRAPEPAPPPPLPAPMVKQSPPPPFQPPVTTVPAAPAPAPVAAVPAPAPPPAPPRVDPPPQRAPEPPRAAPQPQSEPPSLPPPAPARPPEVVVAPPPPSPPPPPPVATPPPRTVDAAPVQPLPPPRMKSEPKVEASPPPPPPPPPVMRPPAQAVQPVLPAQSVGARAVEPLRRMAGFGPDDLMDRLEDPRRARDDAACVMMRRVQFRAGTAVLLPRALDEIETLARVLNAVPDRRIEIGSKLGPGRPLATDAKLRTDRAALVRDNLIESGVAANRISIDTAENYERVALDVAREKGGRVQSMGFCLMP